VAQPYAFGPPPQPQKSNTVLIVFLIIGGVILLVVALVGVLVVLGISGTRKYIANAKTAEALNSVGAISRSAQSAYETETIDVLTLTPVDHRLCPSASHPVPASLSQIRGIKYMSTTSDWMGDSAKNAGFACLKYEMTMPQYYQYDYRTSGSGTKPGDTFTVEAKGDLDGDGLTSSFSLTGTIGAGDVLTVSPAVKQTDPEE
jgi:type IV pilus assembly protein PilA